jgi:hypothetical protein
MAALWNTSFETGEQNSPDAVTKEKAAEIAADFMTTFYHVQVGALETQEFRTMPVPFWLICFSDTIKGALRQFYFVVLLPDGTVVEPTVAKRLEMAENKYSRRRELDAGAVQYQAQTQFA